MMGMTHVFAGTMSALLLTQPRSTRECLAALIGGALGAAACDVDTGRNSHRMESDRTGRMACGIILACFLADGYWNTGLLRGMRSAPTGEMMVGLACLALLLLWGRCQPHRGGTHSVLMLILLGLCVKVICPPASIPAMIGVGSHLVLDLFNCRPVQLLYPLRGGFCLGLCRADGRMDRLIRNICVLGTVFGLGMSLGGYL